MQEVFFFFFLGGGGGIIILEMPRCVFCLLLQKKKTFLITVFQKINFKKHII
jgi:hypothetical protein